jgi:hypothetical protein
LHPEFKHLDGKLDEVFLERLGLTGRPEVWTQHCCERLAEASPV